MSKLENDRYKASVSRDLLFAIASMLLYLAGLDFGEHSGTLTLGWVIA